MKKLTIIDKGEKDSYENLIKTHFSHIEDQQSECSSSKLQIKNNIINIKFKGQLEDEENDEYIIDGL